MTKPKPKPHTTDDIQTSLATAKTAIAHAQQDLIAADLAIDAALGTLPPTAPAGPPQTYPHLRTDSTFVPVTSLPVPAVGQSVVDPLAGQTIWRVTGPDLANGPWGTLSGPNMCQVSADSSSFFAMSDDGSNVSFFNYTPTATPPFTFVKQGFFLTEPTYSRTRPGVVFAPHYNFLITEYDVATDTRKTLFDVQKDVGVMSQDNNQYMSGTYSSQSTPERVCCAYGATQEVHPYITTINVADVKDRCTIDVTRSRMKINGGTWTKLLRADGTPANLNYGIHSTSIDRSGTWLRVDVSGNERFVFFNLVTHRIHDWMDNYWYGHYAWGDHMLLRGIVGAGDKGQYQWLVSDMREAVGTLPPPYRKLIATPPANDQRYEDHTNWNNCRMDGVLVPVFSGTQPSVGQTKANFLDSQLLLVATDPAAPHEVYRIAHHRCDYHDFRDSPRGQIFPNGHAGLFTSNWSGTLLPRRDLFLAQF